MSSQDAGPSISYTPPYTRRRPPNRLSPSAYNIPQRPMVLQHHRRTSGSALTIQTQFNKQPNITSHSATQEYPNNPHFSHMMNSMLGSPYLTTTDIPQTPPHFNLDNNEGEEYDTHRARPPSPAPTADYSFIDVEELEGDNVPTVQMPGSYPYGHRRSISSSFAGFGIQSPAAWSSPRGHTYYTSPGLGGVPFISLNHPTESISMPNIPQQSNPFKTLLPRIWDALSSPGKAFSGSHNINSPPTSSPASIDSSPAGSPRIFSHSISLPTQLFSSQSPSGHHSPLLWNSNSRSQNKGKGRAQPSPYSPFASEPAEDVHFRELSPLDGEEGELIDEACFVDVRAVTGVDILRLLPPELAVYILQLVCPPPVRCHMQHAPGAEKQDPLVNEAEEKSKVALRAILACLTVSRTWRRLASDNPVWHALFLGRWDVDLRKADMSHMWKFEAGSSANIVDSPSRQLKRHRWKLKPRAQAFKFGASLKHSTTQCRRPQSSLLSPHLTPHLAHKALRHPKQNFPLQFDWQKMYMDRLGLEKRWLGTSYVHVPMSLPEEPPCIRETSRSMTSREAPRSRSLSPARLLRGGNTLSAIAGCSVDHLAESTSVGRAAGKTAELRAIPASRTEPVNMNLVFKAEKWEPERRELHGHTDSVYCVDFDSQRIITGSRDRTVIAWSLKTGRRLGTFVGAHTGSVLCLKFERDWDLDSPDLLSMRRTREDGTSLSVDMDMGSRSPVKRTGFMFTGSSDCTICVWSLDTGEVLTDDKEEAGSEGEDVLDRRVLAEPVAILKGHTDGVLDLRIDSRWIVSCSKDTVIRVWDRETLTLHRMLRGHEGPVNALGLQNGRVVSASGDGKMILWDIESGERLRTFDGHDRGLACIEFKNDLIVSGSNDCKIRVWNAWTGECLRTLAGHNALVRAISFDPKTGRLLSASYDKVVKVWDLYSGKLIREFKHTHTSLIFDVKFNLGRIVRLLIFEEAAPLWQPPYSHPYGNVFGQWLTTASDGKMIPTIWIIGIIGVFLCNFAGTNVGATILLAKVIRQANLDGPSEMGAAIAVAVVSDLGAVNLSFSSSRSAFLWRGILQQEGITMTWYKFAKWNSFPLLAMTCVGFPALKFKLPMPFPIFGWRNILIDLYSAPIFAVVVLWALQCLGKEQIYDGIVGTDDIKPYEIIIAFLSLTYISITLDVTALLKMAVFWADNRTRNDRWRLYIYIYIIVTILGLIFSSDPVIHSTSVFLVDFTVARGFQPLPWLISAFAAIHIPTMVLFTGNPTNFIICSMFDISKAVFSVYTILPFAACSIVCLFTMVGQFRGAKYFPSQPIISGWTTPLDSLQDATATVAGIFFLACCLVVSLGLSFLHVDVWKIFLSFAVLKSFIDLFRDHSQFATATRMSSTHTLVASNPSTSVLDTTSEADRETRPTPSEDGDDDQITETNFDSTYQLLTLRFPTFFNALPRLPFGLIPLVFSQSILIEALSQHGWVEFSGQWLATASGGKLIPTIWLVGIIGVLLCNLAGTNIGATILLAKVVRQANLDGPSETGAAIALAVVSNIGAVNLSFSSSRSAFLWRAILQEEGIQVTWSKFAKWNSFPLLAMTCVGLAVVCVEMAVLE
ncbi:hypothetical protein D9756_009703 [Leucocoprinus leucothites]|uniref:Uncharacterized protein n=1 Tax=Leucocoprinus leucothites TaxID=201217 RepID=A0A8H5CVJ3_9AGAR|nr:hypothetical protein D9756_009703 [Leucoagaricus leucothites]